MSEKKLDLYNTRVRRAMSDQYVESSKTIQNLTVERETILCRLEACKHTMVYAQYIELEEKVEKLSQKIHDEKIRLDTWDKAREICLSLADEEA